MNKFFFLVIFINIYIFFVKYEPKKWKLDLWAHEKTKINRIECLVSKQKGEQTMCGGRNRRRQVSRTLDTRFNVTVFYARLHFMIVSYRLPWKVIEKSEGIIKCALMPHKYEEWVN